MTNYFKLNVFVSLFLSDFKAKYLDSLLGLAWVFLEPLAMTLILSFVFRHGMKADGHKAVGFFPYIFAGMISYQFFSHTLNNGVNSIREYSFLVKKVYFPVYQIPVMKICSSTLLHLVMLFILSFILFYHDIHFSFYWLQIIPLFFLFFLFTLGILFMVSSLNVFVPDVRHIVSVLTQFLFYLSPVFWHLEDVPIKWHKLLVINPLYFFINGYRDSFLYSRPIFNMEAIIPSLVSIMLFILGVLVFFKVKKHFTDVI